MAQYAQLLRAIAGGSPDLLNDKFKPVDDADMKVIINGGEPELYEPPPPEVKITKVAPEPTEYEKKRAQLGEDRFGPGASSGFDDLGAAAAWTQNPVLADMWRARREEPYKQAQLAMQMAKMQRDSRENDFDFEQKRAQAPLRLQQMKDEGEARGLEITAKRAEYDPQSPYTQSMREGIASQLGAVGQALGQRGSPNAQLYLDASTKIAQSQGLNAAQLLNAAKPYMDAAGIDRGTLHDQANEAMERARVNQGWAAQGAAADERALRREERTDAREQREKQRAEEKADKQAQLLPQGTQTAEYLDRQTAMKNLARARELINSPKVRYIGKGADVLNTLMSKAPDSLDARTPEEKELSSLLQWIAAPERKELFGSSLTGGEKNVSEELFANIGRNKGSAMQSLKQIENRVREKNGAMERLYPGLLKGQKQQATASQNKSTRWQIGQTATDKNGNQVRWSGERWEVVK